MVGQLNIFEPREEKPTRTPKAQENFDRVQGVLDVMNNGGASQDLVSRYLATEDLDFLAPERPKEDIDPITVGLGLTRGAIKGNTGLFAELPALAVEGLAFGLTKIFDRDASFDSFTTASDFLNKGAKELSSVFDPNFSFEKGQTDVQSAFVNRSAEKVGEFIAPGAFIVKGMSTAGAKLVKESPELLNVFQKMFVQVAKDPAKAQAIEAGFGTLSATSGETAATVVLNNGGTQEEAGYARFAFELSSVISVSMAKSFGEHVTRGFKSLTFTNASREAVATRNASLAINELAEIDPVILKNLAESDKLTALTGVEFNLAEATKNPEIQAATNTLLRTAADPAQTRFARSLEVSRERVTQFVKDMRPSLLNSSSKEFQKEVQTMVNTKFAEMQKRIELTEQKALEEANLLNPGRDANQIGESAGQKMKSLERGEERIPNSIYENLDPATPFKTNHIDAAIGIAKLRPKTAALTLQRRAEGLPEVGIKGGKTQDFGDIPPELIDMYNQTFKDVDSTNLQALRDFREIAGIEERAARLAGQSDTANRIDVIRKGVDRQLNSAPKRSLSAKAAIDLKEANRLWRLKHQRFTDAYNAVGIQRDLNGMFKFSPEDFGRIFVRKEGRKAAVESAKRFRQIFGVGKNGKLLPSARAIIRDTVSYELNAITKNLDGLVREKAIKAWLNNHKKNLQEHGVWNEFKNVGDAARKAAEARVNFKVERTLYNQSILKSVVKSDDIRKTITTMINNGSITRLRQQLIRDNNTPALRGLAQEVWDAVINKSKSNELDAAGNIVRNPDTTLILLKENEKELRKALGNGHYNNLRAIAEVIKRKEGTIETFGEGFLRISKKANLEEETAKGSAKLWAGARGFVSPHFVLGSLLRQGVHIINSKAALNVWREILNDRNMAKEVMKLTKTEGGREALRIFNVAMIPATNDALNTDDERTEL